MIDPEWKAFIALLALAGKISSQTAELLLEDREPAVTIRERPKVRIILEEPSGEVREFDLYETDLSFRIEKILETFQSIFRVDAIFPPLVIGAQFSINDRHWISDKYTVGRSGEWFVYIVKNAMPYDPDKQSIRQSFGGLHVFDRIR